MLAEELAGLGEESDRSESELQALPIIAMTAHAMREERDRCIEAGMDDHVTKPIDPERLYQALARWTRQDGTSPKPPAPPEVDVDVEVAPEPEPTPSMAELPGIDLETGLTIDVEDNVLHIEGEKKEEKEE